MLYPTSSANSLQKFNIHHDFHSAHPASVNHWFCMWIQMSVFMRIHNVSHFKKKVFLQVFAPGTTRTSCFAFPKIQGDMLCLSEQPADVRKNNWGRLGIIRFTCVYYDCGYVDGRIGDVNILLYTLTPLERLHPYEVPKSIMSKA